MLTTLEAPEDEQGSGLLWRTRSSKLGHLVVKYHRTSLMVTNYTVIYFYTSISELVLMLKYFAYSA